MSIYLNAKEYILGDKIILEGVTDRDNCLSYFFKVGEHSVRIYEQQLSSINSSGKVVKGQKIQRNSCDCIKGSLINPKYSTVCCHIVACWYYIIDDIIKKEKWSEKYGTRIVQETK